VRTHAHRITDYPKVEYQPHPQKRIKGFSVLVVATTISGTIKTQGGDGGNQTAQAESFSRGGNGGSSFMGGGGKGGFTSAAGIIGKAFGSGGGGGGFAGGAGSAGRGGIVFIIEFG